jgi:hypothetical protein
VPAAINLYSVRKATDGSREFFLSVQRQKDQYQGVWIVTPEGKVLVGDRGRDGTLRPRRENDAIASPRLLRHDPVGAGRWSAQPDRRRRRVEGKVSLLPRGR